MKKVFSLLSLTLLVIIGVSSCKDKDDEPKVRTSVVGATYEASLIDEEDSHTKIENEIEFISSTLCKIETEKTSDKSKTEIEATAKYTVSGNLITCIPDNKSIVRRINGKVVPVTGPDDVEFETLVFKIGKDYETITLIKSGEDADNIIFKLKK